MPESQVEFFKSGLLEGFEKEVNQIMSDVQGIIERYPQSQVGIDRCKYIETLFISFQTSLFEEIREAGPKDEETLIFLEHFLGRPRMNFGLLASLQTRVIRRAIYCKVINRLELNQMKIAGLYAFWFNKIHPIVINNPSPGMKPLARKYENYLQEINERFAFFIIYNIFTNQYGKPSHSIEGYQERFVHALRFRSFTEDSLMLLTESLGKEAFTLAS